MSVKILKNTDTHKENRILYETGMEKLGFFDLKTKKGDTPKVHPLSFNLNAHAGSHPEGGGDGGEYSD